MDRLEKNRGHHRGVVDGWDGNGIELSSVVRNAAAVAT